MLPPSGCVQLKAEVNDDPGAASRRHVAAQRRAAEDRERRVTRGAGRGRATGRGPPRPGQAERPRQRGKTDGDAAAAGGRRAWRQGAACLDHRRQARVMKMADGGYRPAYNAQFATDTGSGLIAGLAVDNVGSDMGKLRPMSEPLADDYGQRPGEHLVDGGFAKLDDIAALADAGVVVFAPVPAPRKPTPCAASRRRTRHRRLAHPPGRRPGGSAWYRRRQGDLQGARRHRRMRQRPGPQSRPAALPRARPREGQGRPPLVRPGPQYGVPLAPGMGLKRCQPWSCS